MYRYLCEDRQQQRKDSQVSPDPLSSETASQVLWHGHNLHAHICDTSSQGNNTKSSASSLIMSFMSSFSFGFGCNYVEGESALWSSFVST